MKLAASFVFLLPLFAAVDGVVMNVTTGKPQAGVAVVLIQPSEKGMVPLGESRSDEAGVFRIDKDPEGANPALLQASYQTVSYTALVAPNQSKSGIQIKVYDASPDKSAISVDRHGILFEPGEDRLVVREFVFVENKGKTSYVDPANGTYRFYAPGDPKVAVEVTSPGGMPLKRSAEKAGPPNIHKINFPMRPGQTQLELSYDYPLSSPLKFSGNVLHKEGETRLIVPRGFKLEGDGLEAFQPEPQTQSPIYGIKNGPYTVTISGQRIAPDPAMSAEETGQNEIKASRPRIYEKFYPVVGISVAMLAIGLWLMLLNRQKPTAKK